MARNVYISGAEPQSGKSVVALGMLELLSSRADRLGFFRPVAAGGEHADPQLELVRRRYRMAAGYDRMHAVTAAEAAAMLEAGGRSELVGQVIAAFRALADECDVVVCEGIDVGQAPGLDLDLDLELANQLGCPVLAVVRGGDADSAVAAVAAARGALERKGCQAFGVIVGRVPAPAADQAESRLAAAGDEPRVFVLPEEPELARPSVGEVAAALDARVVAGGDGLDRQVHEIRVAAMSVDHFMGDISDGTLVVVPGDRSDILVASLASALSPAVPPVAGLVLTAGYEPAPVVLRLLEAAPFPVLQTDARTYAAATAIDGLRPLIRPGDERKLATALGLFERAVDPLEIESRVALERPTRVTPLMFEYELVERARSNRRHVVLPEGDDDRVLRAADILLRRHVVDLTVLGDTDQVSARAGALGLDLEGARLVDPLSAPARHDYARRYHELRGHKGVTEEAAFDRVADPSYFGTMMVLTGEADGMVSGAAHTTADTIRPAFELVKARPDVSVVSSVFFMCLADRVLVYGDCAVNPKPSVEQLADIAIGSAETAAVFGVEPRIAMLSYSTGTSGKGADVDAVREATDIVRERRPDLPVEGPIQYDAAVDEAVAAAKLPGSEVAGRATVFVFPDLESGNVAYKAVQRSAGAVAIGPVLQGLRRPVNDLSRGCTVPDILNTVAITAVQAQEAAYRESGGAADAPRKRSRLSIPTIDAVLPAEPTLTDSRA